MHGNTSTCPPGKSSVSSVGPGESSSFPRPSPVLKVVLLGDSGVGKTCLRSQFVHHVFSNAYRATIGGDYLTTTVELDASAVAADDKRGLDETLSGQSAADKSVLHDSFDNSESALDNDATATHEGQIDLKSLDECTPLLHQIGAVESFGGKSHTVSLQVWDTAGQERFNSISQAFYRGADVAVLVYDITQYETLLSVRDWLSRFLQYCHVDSPGIVIVGNKCDRAAERRVDKDEVRDILCRNSPVPVNRYISSWDHDIMEISCKSLPAVQAVFRRVAELGLRNASLNHRRPEASPDNVMLDDTQAVSSRCAC